MKLLLDTHIWIWSVLEPGKLTARVRKAVERERNEVWLSPLSIWEFLVLVEKRRVVLASSAEEWIAQALKAAPLKEAPFTAEVALATSQIRLPHRDPIDMFLAATAKVFDLTLVTADTRILSATGIATLANR